MLAALGNQLAAGSAMPLDGAAGQAYSNQFGIRRDRNGANLCRKTLQHLRLEADEIPQGLDLEEIEPMAGKVMKLALADEAFKTKLLSDPKSAIAEAMGLTLPESLEIRVYEDTPTVKHLVLPVNPFNSELSDADLELVAGGKLSPEQNKAICDGVGAGSAIGCAAAAFTTPIAAVASGVSAGSTQAASAIAS